MSTLFVRTLLVYFLMFVVLRLMGKRQINEMQPFDLAVTLLIANLASLPMGDTAIPLLYGIIPIVALFIVQRLVSFASLKSEKLRKLVCGSPVVIVSHGVVCESAMKSANYSLSDLYEQLRLKDVFSLSDVEYAILETNGSLSVMLKSEKQQPSREDLGLSAESSAPSVILVMAGKLHKHAVRASGIEEKTLCEALRRMGAGSAEKCFYAALDADGTLHAQQKEKFVEEARVLTLSNFKKGKQK